MLKLFNKHSKKANPYDVDVALIPSPTKPISPEKLDNQQGSSTVLVPTPAKAVPSRRNSATELISPKVTVIRKPELRRNTIVTSHGVNNLVPSDGILKTNKPASNAIMSSPNLDKIKIAP
jgi:hypothetical protein